MIQTMLKHAAMSRNETSNATEEAPAADVAPAEKAEEAPVEKAEEAPVEKAEEAPVEKAEEAPANTTEEVKPPPPMEEPATEEEMDKIDKILKELDIDGNGQIELWEFYDMLWKEAEPRQKHLEER